MPLQLVIFDDNRDFRESLLQLFRYTPGYEVLGAFADCSEVRERIGELRPQVVLMDIDMPGMNGIEATAIVKEIDPAIQVVMLTVSEEEDRIFQALRNGATGYLLKRTSPDELLDSVNAVSKGGSPMTPAIARKVLQYFQLEPTPPSRPSTLTTTATPRASQTASGNNGSPAATLTPRELEILEGLVDGLSYKMIAARYNISVETVKNHIQGVYRKLQVNSKGEAITYALKQGLAGMPK